MDAGFFVGQSVFTEFITESVLNAPKTCENLESEKPEVITG